MNCKRNYFTFTLLFFLCLSASLTAQKNLDERLSANRATLEQTPKTSIFNPIDKAELKSQAELPQEFDAYSIDVLSTNRILKEKSGVLKLVLPFQGDQITLELVKANIFTSEFKVRAASNPKQELKLDLGVQYWGKVVGQKNSMVALSFSNNEIGGVLSFNRGNFNLGKLKGSEDYILYKASDFDIPISVACQADHIEQPVRTVPPKTTTYRMDETNCVGLYVETALDIFDEEGSVAAVTDKMVLIFNEVIMLFDNEAVNVNLNELFVWDVEDPYDANDSFGYLTDLVNNVSSDAGDLVHLLSYDLLGGVAYLDQLCGNLNYGFSGISPNYNTVPTYSWTVEVITHEIGHNLGSPHTHGCVWNGNGTPIDGCGAEAGFSEGCDGPIPDAGTIMSYCHLISGVGIDFNLGFGEQPGDLIRDEVYNAGCLTTCSECETIGQVCDDGDDCTIGDEYDTLCNCIGVYTDADNDGVCVADDPNDLDPCVPIECPECFDHTLTITLDDFPQETSWDVVDGNGDVIASGGTYGSIPDGTTITETFCLEEGCFDFTIYDSYGDGICCDYGIGSYELADQDGNIIVSGGDFTFDETTSFCVEDSSGPCDVVDSNDIESGFGIWNDGGADAARVNNAAFADSGNFSLMIKDNTSTSVLTTDVLDLGGIAEVTLDFSFLTIGFNSVNHDFWIQVSTNGGASYSTVKEYVYTEDFVNSERYYESVSIFAGFTDNTRIRFRCDAAGNNDKVYIDDVVISQCTESSATCDDGIQNGDETEIDCGGSICVPCEGCYVQDDNDLEVSLGIWVDGGADARRNSNDAPFADSGVFCLRIQDGTDESNFTTMNLDMSSYDFVQIGFSFITNSIEAGEGFVAEISTNGGSSFSTIGTWELNTDFVNGERYFVTAAATGTFTTETKLRLRATGSNNSDRIYIDDILIDGCYNAPGLIDQTSIGRSVAKTNISFKAYPNPSYVSQSINIEIESNSETVNAELINMFGQLILNEIVDKDAYHNYQISTKDLTDGAYFLRIGTKEDFQIEKIMILK